jgi:hypothetical protein
MRQTIKDKAYFEFVFKDKSNRIKTLNTYIKTSDPTIKDWSIIYMQLYMEYLNLFHIKYSMGDPLKSCKKDIILAIKHFITAETNPDRKIEKSSAYIGIYDNVLRLVSLAIIFDIEEELLLELKTVIDKRKGKDFLIDSLLAQKLDIKQLAKKKHFAKVYDKLYPLFEEEGKKEDKMIEYLTTWYKSMRRQHWHNLHKMSKVDGPCPFYGYWAIEAAAVSKVLNLDTSKFRLMDYYPSEL